MNASDEVLDGMVLPGGESTAMGLIGTSTKSGKDGHNVWEAIRQFIDKDKKTSLGNLCRHDFAR